MIQFDMYRYRMSLRRKDHVPGAQTDEIDTVVTRDSKAFRSLHSHNIFVRSEIKRLFTWKIDSCDDGKCLTTT